MNLIAADILFYVTFALLILVTSRTIYLRRSITRQRTAYAETSAQLESANLQIEKLQQIEVKYNTFSSELKQAAMASKFQQTPRILNQANKDQRPPERYTYVHSLTQQGIAAAEIAKILAISAQEADQLVALANISNR
jgi:hypothetical protein